VKVGDIKFTGNQHISSRELRRAMKNLKPIGIPYSIIFENLFAQTFDASKLEEDTERVRLAYRDKVTTTRRSKNRRRRSATRAGSTGLPSGPIRQAYRYLMPVEEGDRYRSAPSLSPAIRRCRT